TKPSANRKARRKDAEIGIGNPFSVRNGVRAIAATRPAGHFPIRRASAGNRPRRTPSRTAGKPQRKVATSSTEGATEPTVEGRVKATSGQAPKRPSATPSIRRPPASAIPEEIPASDERATVALPQAPWKRASN